MDRKVQNHSQNHTDQVSFRVVNIFMSTSPNEADLDQQNEALAGNNVLNSVNFLFYVNWLVSVSLFDDSFNYKKF